MRTEEFFKELSAVENYVFGLDSNTNKNLGFLLVLKNLRSKNLLQNEVVRDLKIIWQTRNKLLNSPGGDRDVPDQVGDLLKILKQKLGL